VHELELGVAAVEQLEPFDHPERTPDLQCEQAQERHVGLEQVVVHEDDGAPVVATNRERRDDGARAHRLLHERTERRRRLDQLEPPCGRGPEICHEDAAIRAHHRHQLFAGEPREAGQLRLHGFGQRQQIGPRRQVAQRILVFRQLDDGHVEAHGLEPRRAHRERVVDLPLALNLERDLSQRSRQTLSL